MAQQIESTGQDVNFSRRAARRRPAARTPSKPHRTNKPPPIGARRVAIYARVSTSDKGQDPENQLAQLREWCDRNHHTIAAEYIDRESGKTAKRPRFADLFTDAHRRKFDVVLFWSLDRFSREGMVPTILHLQRLASCGVYFHSYTEPHLATDNEMVRDILLALLSSLAKIEATKISDRTRAGMERAKRQGKHIGRKPLALEVRRALADHIASGLSPYAAAKLLKIDVKTARKYATEC